MTIRNLVGALLLSVILPLQAGVQIDGLSCKAEGDGAVCEGRARFVIGAEARAQVTNYGTPAPTGGTPPSIWSCTDLGADGGTLTETDSDTLTLNARGEDDNVEGLFCSQSFVGDVQVIAKLSSFTGTTADFTIGGLRIADEPDDASERLCQFAWPNITRNRSKCRSTASGPLVTGLLGLDTSLPTCQAVTRVAATQVVNFFESDDAECDGSWSLVQSGVDLQLTGTNYAGVYALSREDDNLVNFAFDHVTVSDTITITPDGPGPGGPRDLLYEGDAETGEIQSRNATHDGFALKTVPASIATTTHVDCPGEDTFTDDCSGGTVSAYMGQCHVINGGASPSSALDTRVEDGETPPGTGSPAAVAPRVGDFFFRSVIHDDKYYCHFDGNSNKNKPRMNLSLGDDALKIDYDEETYIGFSVYLPENLQHETGVKGPNGKNMLMNLAGAGADTIFSLSYLVPTNAMNGGVATSMSQWTLVHSEDDTDVDETPAAQTHTLLESVEDDLGLWTDFVIRVRVNPFESGQGYSCPVNPVDDLSIAGAKDQSFACDVGILQVWKSTGAPDVNGDRDMVLIYDNLNTGVGLVPPDEEQLDFSFRQYKYSWITNSNSAVTGDVYVAFDEIRFGRVTDDTTDFADVHPSQLACADIAVTPGDCP